jgi:hypothetical protein
MTRASDPLVSTKLRPSQARPKVVVRPRLTARLEREAGRKPTLVCALAGFGKTTLLVEWLKGRQGGERSVAWLSLHEDDNNLARFLLHLVAALRTVEEGVGEGVLAVRCARPSLHALTPWQARWPEDPWRACLEAARLGGDSDTIGAITGPSWAPARGWAPSRPRRSPR